jgi:hypothetical protein
MKLLLLGFALILVSSAAILAQSETGILCVASRAATPFRGQVIPPTGEVDSHGLQVKLDKRPAVPWPQRESLKLESLDLKERHLLAILDARGKPMESIWFRLSNFNSTRLCMSYDEYQGIGLDDDAHCPWCKCR